MFEWFLSLRTVDTWSWLFDYSICLWSYLSCGLKLQWGAKVVLIVCFHRDWKGCSPSLFAGFHLMTCFFTGFAFSLSVFIGVAVLWDFQSILHGNAAVCEVWSASLGDLKMFSQKIKMVCQTGSGLFYPLYFVGITDVVFSHVLYFSSSFVLECNIRDVFLSIRMFLLTFFDEATYKCPTPFYLPCWSIHFRARQSVSESAVRKLSIHTERWWQTVSSYKWHEAWDYA